MSRPKKQGLFQPVDFLACIALQISIFWAELCLMVFFCGSGHPDERWRNLSNWLPKRWKRNRSTLPPAPFRMEAVQLQKASEERTDFADPSGGCRRKKTKKTADRLPYEAMHTPTEGAASP